MFKLFATALLAAAVFAGTEASAINSTDAKVFGIYRTQDNGDTCITPAEKNQSFVTSQEQELLFTIDDPEKVKALRTAISLIYGIPETDLIDFDTQEIYSSTNRPNDLYIVLYFKGCQSMNNAGDPVSFWMPRVEWDNILAISGITLEKSTGGRSGFEPKFITDPRLDGGTTF